jgi:riboflavin kinase/FMN adenylyltransferase
MVYNERHSNKNDENNTCWILGSFKVFHKGHLNLISEAKKKFNFVNILLIHTPNNFRYLYNLNQKMNNIMRYVDKTDFYELNEENFQKTPNEFINLLKNEYWVKNVVCGSDFKFGYMKSGNTKTLGQYFNVVEIEVDQHKISTSDITQLIQDGEVEKANNLLVEKYYIESEVIHGNKFAKKLGYPTANFKIQKNLIIPRDGVYSTETVHEGRKYNSITFIGTPTKDSTVTHRVETHILGFDEDIYGEIIKVYFKKMIRKPMNLFSKEQIICQIEKDIKKAH